MALGTPSDLSLATLALITNNVAKTTNNTSLDACQSESGEDNCAMWASFKIGSSVALNNTQTPGNGFDGRGQFWIKVKGDVGEYMGGTSSGEKVLSSLDVNINAEVAETTPYIWNIAETNVGNEYNGQILGNSNNAGDYEGGFDWMNNTNGYEWSIVQQTTKDQFNWTAV